MFEPGEMGMLNELEQTMNKPEVAKAAGLVLAAWRLYWLARAEMIANSDGKITDANFQVVSQSLSKAACEGFKIGRFKTQVKNEVMPFLKRLSVKEFQMGMRNDTESNESSSNGGHETSSDSGGPGGTEQ